VVPSGAAFATASLPTMPLAPVRFSTTTDCFHSGVSFSAIRRAAMSEAPPGL
jgi:hypothetical protein